MEQVIRQMVSEFKTATLADKKNAIKEAAQEIILCGLSRAGFFSSAAFYGGTALRIFYDLDRFSEDMDFSLMVKDDNFDLASYLPVLEKEVNSYGLNLQSEIKEKTRESAIKSAFLKGNTKEQFMIFFANDELNDIIHPGERIRIKLEVDVSPPAYAGFERKYRLLPVPYEANLYDLPSLFAGKLHAVICRSWKSRIKGRDLYDYIFYLSRDAGVNLKHLQARLAESGYISQDREITIGDVKDMLIQRFDSIDFSQAKEDVIPFINNPRVLDIWSAGFFKAITEKLASNDAKK